MKKAKKEKIEKPESKKSAMSVFKSAFSLNFSKTTWFMLLIALAFFIFVLYVMTKPIPPPINTSYMGPLVPVTGLKLAPGEKYVYELFDQSLGKVRLNSTVKERAQGCIVVEADSNGVTVPFCLDELTGEPKVQQGPDQQAPGQQAGIVPQFTQPWMLALTENWTWGNGMNTTVEWMGSVESIESSSTYRVAAIGKVKGRMAFKVIIDSTVRRVSNGKGFPAENWTQVVWVDSEKRVLLYAGLLNGHIELVEAPFKVEPYAEPA